MLYYQDLPAKKVKNIINLVRSQKTRYKKSKNDVLEGNLVFYGMMILFFSMFLFGAVLAVSHIGGFSIIEIKDTLINIGYFLLFGVFLIFYSFIHGYFSKNSLRSNL